MARGRFITNEIARDKRINDLSSDTSRLAFTWLITFADCEGRTYGDPTLVRSMIFPRRADVSIETMTQIITEWASAGLIEWYEANGDMFIYFPAFDKHQSGLRKSRETPSIIPPLLRSNSGVTPEQLPVKLIKLNINSNIINRTEEENDSFSQMQQLLETTIGLPTNQADIETVNECVKLQIIEEDIKQALAWRKDTGKAPAKTITQLIGSIRNYRNKRIQDSNAATTRQEQASEVYG